MAGVVGPRSDLVDQNLAVFGLEQFDPVDAPAVEKFENIGRNFSGLGERSVVGSGRRDAGSEDFVLRASVSVTG